MLFPNHTSKTLSSLPQNSIGNAIHSSGASIFSFSAFHSYYLPHSMLPAHEMLVPKMLQHCGKQPMHYSQVDKVSVLQLPVTDLEVQMRYVNRLMQCMTLRKLSKIADHILFSLPRCPLYIEFYTSLISLISLGYLPVCFRYFITYILYVKWSLLVLKIPLDNLPCTSLFMCVEALF